MKAKEYFQKHIADLPKQINGTLFCKMLTDTYNEFNRELRAALAPLKMEASQLSKIREFDKKWVAIAELAGKHFDIPELHQRPLGDDNSMIDRSDLEGMKQFFMFALKTNYGLLYRRLQETQVAPDRRRNGLSPRFHAGDQDHMWRYLMQVVNSF